MKAFFKTDLYEGRNGSAVSSIYDIERAEILRRADDIPADAFEDPLLFLVPALAVCALALLLLRLLPWLLIRGGGRERRLPLLLTGLSGILAILALAGPAWQRQPTPFAEDQAAVFLLKQWRDSIEGNRRQLEKRVEEAVQRSVARFTLPTQEDLKNLGAQIQSLEERVEQIEAMVKSHHPDADIEGTEPHIPAFP